MDIQSAIADRAALSAGFERELLMSLLSAADLTDLLGADVPTVVDELLAAEFAAVQVAWLDRGIDPGAAAAALQAPPAVPTGEAAPAEKSARRQSGAGVGGVMALIAGMTSAFEPIFEKQPDPATGRVVDTATITTTNTSEGLAITVDERVSVDLGYCPDAVGTAEGTVNIEVDLMATGISEGEPLSLRASGTFTIMTTVQSDAQAHLARLSHTVTGAIVGTAQDGESRTWADLNGLGGEVGVGPDGEITGGRGHGSATGAPEDIQGFADAFQLSGAVIALMHGKSGEYWWSGGNCVALEVNEQPDTASGESVDVVVTAAHLIDRGPVEGTVRATASNGTVEPQEGDVPATFHLTVEANQPAVLAQFELRSYRGVAKGSTFLDARGYRVEAGEAGGVTATGTKCEGPVGPWTLTIGGAVEDAGVEIAFTGSLTFQVAKDLSATYTIDIGATATNLPPQLVGLLDFSGGGNARFVDDPQSPRFELLDGDLAVAGSVWGPGIPGGGLVAVGPAGTATVPVVRAACAG